MAWFVHCWPRAQVATEGMELLEDRPGGLRLQLLRCRHCGTERACRPGWRTRCHICLDRRSAQDLPAMRQARDALATFRANRQIDLVRQFLGLRTGEPTPLPGVAEFLAATALEATLDSYRRPGWTVLAGDVHGLPWMGTPLGSASHGTWGRHDACGTVAKLNRGRTECPTCPPESDSRTHRARANDPHLLYLVRYRHWHKFGHGDDRRVRAHLRAGARVVQVLAATHAEVVIGESALKRRHREHAVGARPTMPFTFGTGTEVLPTRIPVDLTTVLPSGRDVTHRYID
ncbi:hypothetical protein KUTG_02489 [Kutzneria sp. 744]|nr:hypothetical protein KUTG_02489 [Kutzneria sp. 744]